VTALSRFSSDTRRDRARQVRAPKGALFSLDGPDLANIEIPAAAATPETAFDYAWVTDLLDQVLAEVRTECSNSSMATHWEVFRLRVLAPIFEDTRKPSLSKVCRECGVENERTASNMIITVNRRFQKVLKRRLKELTGSEAEAEAEFAEILRFLSDSCAGL
jgi:hypothetical protein